MNWAGIVAAWRWLVTSRYVRSLEQTNAVLEEENAALRRDNRALQNSLMGQAGIAPLPPNEADRQTLHQGHRLRRLSYHQQQRVHAARTAKVASSE